MRPHECKIPIATRQASLPPTAPSYCLRPSIHRPSAPRAPSGPPPPPSLARAKAFDTLSSPRKRVSLGSAAWRRVRYTFAAYPDGYSRTSIVRSQPRPIRDRRLLSLGCKKFLCLLYITRGQWPYRLRRVMQGLFHTSLNLKINNTSIIKCHIAPSPLACHNGLHALQVSPSKMSGKLAHMHLSN